MKNIILLFLLVSCSTVKELYTDVMTPEKDEPAPAQVTTPAEKTEVKEEPVKTSSVTYEDEVSKNWDYQRQIGSYIARTDSIDKKATMIILRDTGAKIMVGVQAVGTQMKYREGHSVEVKVDGEFSSQRVEPTDGDSIKFTDSLKFAQSLKGKKQLEISVLNKEGPRTYKFDISGLQDFFTTI